MPCRIWTCLDCHTTTREAEPRHGCLDMTRHSEIRRDILHLASTCQTPAAQLCQTRTRLALTHHDCLARPNLTSHDRDMTRKALTA